MVRMSSANPKTEAKDSGRIMKGKVSPDSTLDVRDQVRLYEKEMGKEATVRQATLRRKELWKKRSK
jgi:hypothetical protein